MSKTDYETAAASLRDDEEAESGAEGYAAAQVWRARPAVLSDPAAKSAQDRPAAKTAGEASRALPPGAPEAGGTADPARKRGGRRALLTFTILTGLGAAGYYGDYWWTEGRFLVSTDDAYVRADLSVIAARVSGYVTDVRVTDNTSVKAGDVLAKIDDRDYKNAVEAAENKISTQDATIARLKDQATAQKAVIEQAKAQVASAKANQVRTEADFKRASELAQHEFSSRKTLDQARADRDQANASVQAAAASQQSAEANLAVLNAQVKEAERASAELETALEKARLDLSYTTVTAPFGGVVGNKAVQVGQYVQPGARLLSLVPMDTVYIEANYKETQLDRIRPGQKADITVDAADGREFHGVVESIAPASGSQYSLLPPENATGNFTKIVQRVPVRIRAPAEAVREGVLRPGLSVVTYVHTKVAGEQGQAVAAEKSPDTKLSPR